MPLFHYKATNLAGEVLEGHMESIAQKQVVEHLQGMGYVPIRVEETIAGAGSSLTKMSLGRKRGIRQDDISNFTREIATLLRSGLPLDRALQITINLSDSEPVSNLLKQIREDVRGGASLFSAMEAQKGVFSRFYLNMIRAGEAGGALDVVLSRLVEFMERSKELKDTVKSALIYPAILVLVAVLSVMVLLMFVVPQFSQMFEESGKALPLSTQIVIGAGEFIRDYWWAIVLGGVAVYTYLRRQLENSSSRYSWDRRILTAPLAGDLVAKLEMARFSRTLGTLLTNGVTLLTALSIVKETLTNSVMSEKLDAVSAQLREGRGLGQPLMEAGVFPKLGVHMVLVGEETGRLSEMLIRVADVFDREVQTTVKRILGLLEPILILGLGLVIGGIIMSILVAILSVNELTL
jgi:general secretion pathway protein F